jgi:hypothetical protein
MSNGKGLMTRALVLAVAAFLALPMVTLAQGRGNGRHKDDVFVNGHDARDGRYDNRGPRRDDDQWRRERERRRREYENESYRRRDPRDRDGDGDYDSRDVYIQRQQERNNGYGTYGNRGYGTYGNNGTYGNRGYSNYGYGNYGQSEQTALNAGYNEGVKEGRRDRSRGGYRNLDEFGVYRSADKDYNSRYGDRSTYQQYFRRGFENGYRDGLNGY